MANEVILTVILYYLFTIVVIIQYSGLPIFNCTPEYKEVDPQYTEYIERLLNETTV